MCTCGCQNTNHVVHDNVVSPLSNTQLSKKKQRFFEIARQVSLMSDFPRIKIGCILVMDKKHIISSGVNKQKTHPEQFLLNKKYKANSYKEETSFIHAEMDAISSLTESFLYKYYYNLSNVEIYLYRESNQNGKIELHNCRPCNSCMMKLMQLGIKKIHYTTEFGFHTEKINK